MNTFFFVDVASIRYRTGIHDIYIFRWRSEAIPPTPDNQSDVKTDVEFTRNARGESIIVGDDKGEGLNDRVITMSTSKLLKQLGRVKRINVDATFKSSPNPNWAAVLIIFGLLGAGMTGMTNSFAMSSS